MPRALRSIFFSLVLGFHNAWEQDDAGPEELGRHFRVAYRVPFGHDALARPERCFFWGGSSLLN